MTGGVYWWQVGPSLTVLSCHPTRIPKIPSTKHEMGSLRPQNQKCNQIMDGSAPSPKSGLDPTQPINPATKHTVR